MDPHPSDISGPSARPFFVAKWLAYEGSRGLDQDAVCGELRRRLIEAFAAA